MRRLLFSLAAAAAANAVAAQTPSELSVVLKPGAMDEAAGRGFVDVTLTVPQADASTLTCWPAS